MELGGLIDILGRDFELLELRHHVLLGGQWMNPYSLPAFSQTTLWRTSAGRWRRSRSMNSLESGHTPSGWGKSEPHMMVSCPKSSSSLMPMRSLWKVARHCRRQYSLGRIVRLKSLN